MIEVKVDGSAAQRIEHAARQLGDASLLFRAIAGALETETEANFAAQGRPPWVPLSAATRRERLRRNQGSSVLKILQDRGILAASVSSQFGRDFALVGAGTPYAAAHQFGAKIDMPPKSVQTRLRTDAKGNLVRQGTGGAVFAKDAHKRARSTWSTVEPHSITIPARPFLPFAGSAASATLQPEAERSVLTIVNGFLAGAFG